MAVLLVLLLLLSAPQGTHQELSGIVQQQQLLGEAMAQLAELPTVAQDRSRHWSDMTPQHVVGQQSGPGGPGASNSSLEVLSEGLSRLERNLSSLIQSFLALQRSVFNLEQLQELLVLLLEDILKQTGNMDKAGRDTARYPPASSKESGSFSSSEVISAEIDEHGRDVEGDEDDDAGNGDGATPAGGKGMGRNEGGAKGTTDPLQVPKGVAGAENMVLNNIPNPNSVTSRVPPSPSRTQPVPPTDRTKPAKGAHRGEGSDGSMSSEKKGHRQATSSDSTDHDDNDSNYHNHQQVPPLHNAQSPMSPQPPLPPVQRVVPRPPKPQLSEPIREARPGGLNGRLEELMRRLVAQLDAGTESSRYPAQHAGFLRTPSRNPHAHHELQQLRHQSHTGESPLAPAPIFEPLEIEPSAENLVLRGGKRGPSDWSSRDVKLRLVSPVISHGGPRAGPEGFSSAFMERLGHGGSEERGTESRGERPTGMINNLMQQFSGSSLAPSTETRPIDPPSPQIPPPSSLEVGLPDIRRRRQTHLQPAPTSVNLDLSLNLQTSTSTPSEPGGIRTKYSIAKLQNNSNATVSEVSAFESIRNETKNSSHTKDSTQTSYVPSPKLNLAIIPSLGSAATVTADASALTEKRGAASSKKNEVSSKVDPATGFRTALSSGNVTSDSQPPTGGPTTITTDNWDFQIAELMKDLSAQLQREQQHLQKHEDQAFSHVLDHAVYELRKLVWWPLHTNVFPAVASTSAQFPNNVSTGPATRGYTPEKDSLANEEIKSSPSTPLTVMIHDMPKATGDTISKDGKNIKSLPTEISTTSTTRLPATAQAKAALGRKGDQVRKSQSDIYKKRPQMIANEVVTNDKLSIQSNETESVPLTTYTAAPQVTPVDNVRTETMPTDKERTETTPTDKERTETTPTDKARTETTSWSTATEIETPSTAQPPVSETTVTYVQSAAGFYDWTWLKDIAMKSGEGSTVDWVWLLDALTELSKIGPIASEMRALSERGMSLVNSMAVEAGMKTGYNSGINSDKNQELTQNVGDFDDELDSVEIDDDGNNEEASLLDNLTPLHEDLKEGIVIQDKNSVFGTIQNSVKSNLVAEQSVSNADQIKQSSNEDEDDKSRDMDGNTDLEDETRSFENDTSSTEDVRSSEESNQKNDDYYQKSGDQSVDTSGTINPAINQIEYSIILPKKDDKDEAKDTSTEHTSDEDSVEYKDYDDVDEDVSSEEVKRDESHNEDETDRRNPQQTTDENQLMTEQLPVLSLYSSSFHRSVPTVHIYSRKKRAKRSHDNAKARSRKGRSLFRHSRAASLTQVSLENKTPHKLHKRQAGALWQQFLANLLPNPSQSYQTSGQFTGNNGQNPYSDQTASYSDHNLFGSNGYLAPQNNLHQPSLARYPFYNSYPGYLGYNYPNFGYPGHNRAGYEPGEGPSADVEEILNNLFQRYWENVRNLFTTPAPSTTPEVEYDGPITTTTRMTTTTVPTTTTTPITAPVTSSAPSILATITKSNSGTTVSPIIMSTQVITGQSSVSPTINGIALGSATPTSAQKSASESTTIPQTIASKFGITTLKTTAKPKK